jgi:hypothetical protein
MRCAACGGEMIALFISTVCERCNAPQGERSNGLERGYIVWRSRPPGSCEYVFRSRDDAERWRAAAGLDRFPIRAVLSRTSFKWRRSTGSVRDIELADRLFEIFPDDGGATGPNRAFLDAA